jgi:hypothetical protein
MFSFSVGGIIEQKAGELSIIYLAPPILVWKRYNYWCIYLSTSIEVVA